MSNNSPKMNFVKHILNIEKNFLEINPFSNPSNVNMKTDKNLLMSQINKSVMVLEHPHPLYSCFTPGRNTNQNSFWLCNNSESKFS